ncbi:MAG: endo alpha-1,4 polygalactosaminidase, partial [Actinomycetota bacterium]|nr:endo alpha-1,4 polygalactosaminidase [Actinomycetota bacterium]
MKSIAKVMVLATALACFGISASSSSARTMEASSEIWRPALGVTWQWQLGGGKLDASFDVDVYDIDGFDNSKAIVDRLHGKG